MSAPAITFAPGAAPVLRPRVGSHRCPVTGCRIDLPGSVAMCDRDARRIPKAERRAIASAEKSGDGTKVARAWRQAIAAVERKLGISVSPAARFDLACKTEAELIRLRDVMAADLSAATEMASLATGTAGEASTAYACDLFAWIDAIDAEIDLRRREP